MSRIVIPEARPAVQDGPARRAEASVRPSAERWALLLAALVVAMLAAERVAMIPVHVSFNPNEGWNAFQTARAFGGGPLYPPPGGLIGDNYPPLSFLLVGGIARLTGADLIEAGRWVSLAAVLATAASVAWAVRRLEPARSSAPAVAALVVLGFAATQFRAYLAMDDPQWLAHALMTPAIPLLLPARPDGAPRAGRVAAAALLVVAGGLVKHNLVALPVAATLWLALHHRRALLVWVGVGVAAAAVALGGMAAVYGADAFRDILQVPRHGSLVRMLRASAGPVLAQVPLLVAAAPLLHQRRGDRRLDLPLLFIAVAVPMGVLQRSGQGVNFNAHFEALAALAIGGGAALSHALADGDAATLRRRLAWLALPFAVLVPLAAQAAWAEARVVRVERGAWSDMTRRIARAPGPAACETLALCYWAGQPFVLDTFLYGQRIARTGDASALLRSLHTGAIALVQREPKRRPKAGDVADPVARLLDSRDAVVFRAADGRWLEVPRRSARPATALAGLDAGRVVVARADAACASTRVGSGTCR